MTQHYLHGELSLILWELEVLAADEASAREYARLRREAETVPLAGLASVAVRALALAGASCWDSLVRGDGTAFGHQAVVFVELSEFAVCAGLVADG